MNRIIRLLLIALFALMSTNGASYAKDQATPVAPTTEESATEAEIPPTIAPTSTVELPQPTATETQSPEPSATYTPVSTLEPTATYTETAEPTTLPEFSVNSAIHGELTVNGSTGPLYVSTSDPLHFHIPDFAGLGTTLATYPHSTILAGQFRMYYQDYDCHGGYNYWRPEFLPNADYSFDMTHPPISDPDTYSFEAAFWLYDPIHYTNPLYAVTQCVNIGIASSQPHLVINGQGSPAHVDDVTPLTLVGSPMPQEAGVTLTYMVLESTSAGCGSPWKLAEYNSSPAALAFNLPARASGNYWFQMAVFDVSGFRLAETECVQLVVSSAAATLAINGQTSELIAADGLSVNLYATGLPIGSTANLMYFPRADCAGSGFIDPTSPYMVNAAGVVDTSFVLYAAGRPEISAYFAGTTKHTNCVTVKFQQQDAILTVNGSPGPIGVVVGDELHLEVTGLPPGTGAYPVLNCDFTGTYPPEDLPGTVGGDGTIEFFMSDPGLDEFAIRVVLEPPSEVSTNCVFVRYFDFEVDPMLRINGSQTEHFAFAGEPYALDASGLPPVTSVSLHKFAGSTYCSGSFSTETQITSESGELHLPQSATETGIVSWYVETPKGNSNCVVATVIDQPVLSYNGSTAPGSISHGITLQLTANNWPQLGVTTTNFQLERSAGAFCLASGFNVSSFPAPTVSGPLSFGVSGLEPGVYAYRITGTYQRPGEPVQVESNCLVIEVRNWSPELSIDGESFQLNTESGTTVDSHIIQLPDTAETVLLNRYPVANCTGSGDDSVAMAITSAEASASESVTAPDVATGTTTYVSYRAQVTYRSDTGAELQVSTNCVNVTVFAPDVVPTATSEHPLPTATGDALPTTEPGEPTPTTPAGNATGTISLTIQTEDSGDIPDTGQLCIDDACSSIGSFEDNAFVALAASGSTYLLGDVSEGTHQLSVTNVAPYASAVATFAVSANQTTMAVMVLSLEADGTPDNDDPASPDDETQPAATAPDSDPVVTLPSTGAAGASQGEHSAWLLLALALFAVTCAIRGFREGKVR